MKGHVKGEFQVKLLPQTDERTIPLFARMTIDKEFHGELSGTSQGQMLSAGTAVPNSAGYVAIEKVTGTLEGKKGSFVLQHSAIMDKGQPSLSVIVIPDSGSEELTGISGELDIIRKDGKHFYDFQYKMPD